MSGRSNSYARNAAVPMAESSSSAAYSGVSTTHLETPGQSQDPSKKKPAKKAVSCESCRRRKLKCDRGWPCGACRDRGESSLCEWAEGVKPQTAGRDASADSKPVLDRLDKLEAMMGAIASKMGIALPGQDAQKGKGSPIDHYAPNNMPASLWSRASAVATPRSESGSFSHEPVYEYIPGVSSILRTNSEDHCRKVLFQLLGTLPDGATLDRLCSCYFSEMAWLAHVINVEEFHARLRNTEEMRLLWNGRAGAYSQQELRTSLRFVALLFAVLGGVLVFSDPLDTAQLDEEYGQPAYGVFLDASQRALSAVDIYDDASIDNVRTLLLVSTSVSALKGPSVGTSILVNAYYIAFALQLDAEPPKHLPLAQRLDRLSLFATLCISDWFSAGTTKRNFYIDSEKLQLPSLFGPDAEVDDVLPLAHRYKLKVADVSRRATLRSRLSDEAAYDETMKLSEELRALDATLPRDLRYDDYTAEGPEGVELWMRVTLKLASLHQQIMLHKRFYIQSWTTPKYKHSRDICFLSASKTVKTFRGALNWFKPREDSTMHERQELMDQGLKNHTSSISRLWFFAQGTIIASLILVHFLSMLDAQTQDVAEWDSPTIRGEIADDLRFVRLLLQALSAKCKVARDGAKAMQPLISDNARKRKPDPSDFWPGSDGRKLPSPSMVPPKYFESSHYPLPQKRRVSGSPSNHQSPDSAAQAFRRPEKVLTASSATSFDDIEALWSRPSWPVAHSDSSNASPTATRMKGNTPPPPMPVPDISATGTNGWSEFFGPDSTFGDIASSEAAIGKQDPTFLNPVAPLSPFTSAFISSLDTYVQSLDAAMLQPAAGTSKHDGLQG